MEDLYRDYLREIDKAPHGSNLHLEDVNLLLCMDCGTESLVPIKRNCTNPECKGKDHPKVFVLEYVIIDNINKAFRLGDLHMYREYNGLLADAYRKQRF